MSATVQLDAPERPRELVEQLAAALVAHVYAWHSMTDPHRVETRKIAVELLGLFEAYLRTYMLAEKLVGTEGAFAAFPKAAELLSAKVEESGNEILARGARGFVSALYAWWLSHLPCEPAPSR